MTITLSSAQCCAVLRPRVATTLAHSHIPSLIWSSSWSVNTISTCPFRSIQMTRILITYHNTSGIVDCKSFVAFEHSSHYSAYVNSRSFSGADLYNNDLAISKSIASNFAIISAITNRVSSSCILMYTNLMRHRLPSMYARHLPPP